MKKLTTEEFIKRAKEIHGDRYDYSKTVYVGANEKIEIICFKHGCFLQRMDQHIQMKQGCPKCGLEKRKSSLEYVISRFEKIHNKKYIYDKVEYKNDYTKVEIICPEHGSFFQAPFNHFAGQGCLYCTKKYTTEEFVEKASKIHNNRYDYLRVEYRDSHTKIHIICPKHGSFYQNAGNHLNGHGCPSCRETNSSVKEKLWLNSQNIPDKPENRQVRIKTNNKTYVVDGYIPETNTIYEFFGDYWHGNPEIFKDGMNKKCGKSYKELYQKTISKIKLLKEIGYNVIYIWEKDFK